MANFLVVQRDSNLIVNLVTSSFDLSSNAKLKVIKAGDLTLNHYHRLKAKADAKGVLVDAGELANLSPNFKELLRLK